MNVTIEIKETVDGRFYIHSSDDSGNVVMSPMSWKKYGTAEKWAIKMKETNEFHGIPTKVEGIECPQTFNNKPQHLVTADDPKNGLRESVRRSPEDPSGNKRVDTAALGRAAQEEE